MEQRRWVFDCAQIILVFVELCKSAWQTSDRQFLRLGRPMCGRSLTFRSVSDDLGLRPILALRVTARSPGKLSLLLAEARRHFRTSGGGAARRDLCTVPPTIPCASMRRRFTRAV